MLLTSRLARRALRVACLTFLIASRASAQDTVGVGGVSGVVLSQDGTPAPAATVCLAGTTRCVLTDESGRFRLADVRPADYVLEIRPPGQPPRSSGTITVRAGLDATVEVTLPRVSDVRQEITVTAPAFVAPEEVKTSAFLIQPAEILRSAGALQDVSRYVQSLPGVAIGTNDFRNDLIVRGGSPLENLFIVDNVEIPNINAFANFSSAGGTVGLVDSTLIRDVTFLTGGFPAPYGNRVSSVMQITQRDGDRERFRGRATLGFAGSGAVLEGPIAKGRGSWIVSARRSFLDFFTDDIGVGGVPVAYTLNGKVLLDVGERDRVWFVNVSGVDRIRLGLTDDTGPDEPIADLDIRYRGWRSASGFNWQRLFGSNGVGLFGVSHSSARVRSTVKDLIRDGIPPAGTPADQVIDAGSLVFREGSGEDETNVKYDFSVALRRAGRMQVGGSLKIFRLDYDTASPLGSDSPFSTDRGVNAFSLQRAFTAYQGGGYAQLTTDLTSRLNTTVGLRVDRFQFLDASRLAPRLGTSLAVTNRLSWRASYGQYFQQPLFLFIAAFPENAALSPLRADHYVTGLTFVAREDLRLSAEVYRKRYSDYPVSSQFPALSLANLGDTFNVRDILFPLVTGGRGDASGVELSFEKKPTGRWYGQGNLSIARARHRGIDDIPRPGSFDYPFVLNVDGGVQISSSRQLSAKFSWLGGRPYTPFDDAVSRAAARGIFDLTRVNAERSIDYFRVDVRFEQSLSLAGRPFIFFGGVQNLTNRRNFAGYDWDRRKNAPRLQEQMGIFPILGFEWRF